jgi:hypothetical protein
MDSLAALLITHIKELLLAFRFSSLLHWILFLSICNNSFSCQLNGSPITNFRYMTCVPWMVLKWSMEELVQVIAAFTKTGD